MGKKMFLIAFVLFAQHFYGQEKYTIQGEFPDHSMDGEYVILSDQSSLPEEYKRKSKLANDEVKILVNDKKFYYEGIITRKPFRAQISYRRPMFNRQVEGTSFVVEPGNIHIRVTNWYDEGNVSGTPINDNYNTYIIERRNLMSKISRTIINERIRVDSDSVNSAYSYLREGELFFLEKYAQYPDIVRVTLSRYLGAENWNKRLNISEYLRVLDLMPKADRDILLAWRDYTIKREEYWAKRRVLVDSLNRNAPRFIEKREKSIVGEINL